MVLSEHRYENNAVLGQGGYKYLVADGLGGETTGTAVAGVEYVAVTVLVASAVTTVANDTTTWPNLSAITVPAGTTIYGRWNKVTLSVDGSSAQAIVYKA